MSINAVFSVPQFSPCELGYIEAPDYFLAVFYFTCTYTEIKV